MTALSAASVFRDYETDGVPISGPHRPIKADIRDLFAGFDALLVTPRNYGAAGDGVTDDKVAVQAAIDGLSALYVANGLPRTLWFDAIYIVGGAKHANGFSIIDAKPGVFFDGPGGFKLAANTNVPEAIFKATCTSTTMTVTEMDSGTIVANMFLTGPLTGTGFAPATQVVTQLSGTTGGLGTYQINTSNTVASQVSVRGIRRMVDLVGCYDTTGNRIDDCTWRNIIFDYNGANNCDNGDIWSFNAVVSIQSGAGNSFDRLRFRNNCGSNSIVFGNYQASPTFARSTISFCSFSNDGDRVNAASVDYSTVFLVGNDCVLIGNRFSLGPSSNGAAWELYGLNNFANDNDVSDYYNICNLVAIAGQTSTIDMNNNRARNISVGITLWTFATSSKLYVSGQGNVFDYLVAAAGGPYLLNGVDQVTAGSEVHVTFIGNRGRNGDKSDTARTSDAISLKSALYAKFLGNTLEGFPGRGIWITGSLVPAAYDIIANKMLDVGYTATTAKKKGIVLDASTGSSGSLLIAANDINPISGYTLTAGIDNALSVDSGLIDASNLILSAAAPVINTGTGVMVKSLGGVGYGASELGTVTQATSKATGVTLNKRSGKITMNNAALAGGATVSFTLTNSLIEANDTPVVTIASGATAGAYRVEVDAVAGGSCRISVSNTTGGSLGEAIVLNFNLIKGGS